MLLRDFVLRKHQIPKQSMREQTFLGVITALLSATIPPDLRPNLLQLKINHILHWSFATHPDTHPHPAYLDITTTIIAQLLSINSSMDHLQMRIIYERLQVRTREALSDACKLIKVHRRCKS